MTISWLGANSPGRSESCIDLHLTLGKKLIMFISQKVSWLKEFRIRYANECIFNKNTGKLWTITIFDIGT